MVRTLPGSPQALRGGRLPDFLLVGAPKAGTTALHAALAAAPRAVPEPGEGAEVLPVRRLAAAGVPRAGRRAQQPGVDLAAAALPRPVPGRRRRPAAGESTPFYLYHRDARRRIAADLPRAKLVAVLRDPVDRAYSNWMHLWADGLEPCADVVEACAREAAAGRRRLGAVLALPAARDVRPAAGRPASSTFPREQVLVLRYRELVDEPAHRAQPGRALPRRRGGRGHRDPAGNSRPFVHPSVRTRVLGPVVRAGAKAGQFLPPQAWRAASKPIIGQLHQRGNPARPRLTPEQRDALREPFLEDIALLEELTGESYEDWRTHRDGDSFHTRQSQRSPPRRGETRWSSGACEPRPAQPRRRWSSGRAHRRAGRPRSRSGCRRPGSGTAAT